MTPEDLNELRKALSITELKQDIKDLRGEVKELDKKLSTFWFKVAMVFLTFTVITFISQIVIKMLTG